MFDEALAVTALVALQARFLETVDPDLSLDKLNSTDLARRSAELAIREIRWRRADWIFLTIANDGPPRLARPATACTGGVRDGSTGAEVRVGSTAGLCRRTLERPGGLDWLYGRARARRLRVSGRGSWWRPRDT